jgi:hypothetical protein
MKNAGKILGILFLSSVAFAGCHNDRHEKKEMKSEKRTRMEQRTEFRHNLTMNKGQRSDFGGRRADMRNGMHKGPGMRGGMGMGPGQGMEGRMSRSRNQVMQPGMQRGMGMGMNTGMANGQRQGMMGVMRQESGSATREGMRSAQPNPDLAGTVAPGGISINNIPNVSDKQRKEFAELLKKQQDDMAKMRSEMAAKIRSTIESNRSKMLKLFTDDQKKYLGTPSGSKK